MQEVEGNVYEEIVLENEEYKYQAKVVHVGGVPFEAKRILPKKVIE